MTKRIMFVCHGNICRSPMAEIILKDMLKRRNIDDVTVASCSTSTEEIHMGVGNPVYPPARAELAKHGLDAGGKRAVQLKKSDYDKYDVFYCMDDKNIRNAISIVGGDKDGKFRKLLAERDVSDPWYSDRFDIAYSDIEEGCLRIVNSL